jgi:hypothetical protein
LPAAAEAGTASLNSSGALVYTGGSGERNNVSVADNGDGRVYLSDVGGVPITPGPGCEQLYTDARVACTQPTEIVVNTGDNQDWVGVDDDTPVPVRADGGDGPDQLHSDLNMKVPVTFLGGAGNDELKGWHSSEELDGGDGDDTIEAGAGADRIRGGAGDDKLTGDGIGAPSPDVIDGGPGFDTLSYDWLTEAARTNSDITATLGGGADDGRPGEGDDLTGVEGLDLLVGGNFTGTDAAESIVLHQVGANNTMIGLGGDDHLEASAGNDRIDGGTGADLLEGGYGDDTILGGAGADNVRSDGGGDNCGPSWCTVAYGNDTVEVRDGEADSVTCGPGEDRVVADQGDVVARDCEVVDRGSGPGPGPGPGPDPGPNPAPPTSLQVSAKGGKLRKALTSGLTVTFKAGSAGTANVAVAKGRKVVAKGVKRLSKAGTYSTRVKFPKRVRKSLSRARKATFSITVTVKPSDGSAPQTQTIKTTLKR